MDELGIITAGDGKETGSKIYGFEKLYNARMAIDRALKKEQFGDLENLKKEYEKQLQNIREMYKIIKSELNPNPESIPGNVQNYREDFVPAEFKNDICTNATFNGMYNAYSIVKSIGISHEEFLSNPQQYIDENFNNEITKFHIDKFYKDLSFNETLVRVYSDRSKEGLNSHGMPRMVTTLTLFEKNAERKRNNLIYGAVQNGKVATISVDEQICYNYFRKERTNTFINLLLVNPEDKDFINLKSYDSITSDGFHKTKAFDLASYLREKDIPAETIYERVTSLLATAYNYSYNSEKKYSKEKAKYDALLKDYKSGKIKTVPKLPDSSAMSKEKFAQMVKDVQQGVIDYMMLSNPERHKGMDKLEGILKNPINAFKNINLDKEYIEELNSLKGKDVVLNEIKQRAKNESGLNIKNIRTDENLYNKRVEKILKDANKISSKVANESDMKKVEELQKQSVLKMNELKALQKLETERLDREYKQGNIPSDYYKKRVENILSLKHNDKVSIFDDGLDKNQYIRSTGLEELSKSEKDKLFECEIQKQKAEKEIFINRQFLQKNNLISINKDIQDIQVQQGNFEQIDINQIDNIVQEEKREPLIVNEAKIENVNRKSELQKEIDPKQAVKMP